MDRLSLSGVVVSLVVSYHPFPLSSTASQLKSFDSSVLGVKLMIKF
jgi:hypothetical protein